MWVDTKLDRIDRRKRAKPRPSLEVVGSAERTFERDVCARDRYVFASYIYPAHRKRRSRLVERLLRTAVVSGGVLLLVGCRVISDCRLETCADML